ncbi:MAG: carbohydrate kinase [Clostridia bacterium]|nr:carbohydrate kinase [Clostridia bacterium]
MLVTAIGELLIDFTQSGETADGYPVLTANPGGAPANFLAAVKACGHDAALLGKVGDDAFGQRLIGTLRQKGVITDGIVTAPDVFTTLAFVTLDGAGDRSFSFARKPGADTCLRPEELDLSLLDAADVLHFGTLSMTDEPAKSATLYALDRAKAQKKAISFDPNYRPALWKDEETARDAMRLGLQNADIVKLSDEEAAFLYGGLSPEAACKRLLADYPVSLVFLTRGKDGCTFATRACSGEVPVPAGITPIDTTGAGDIFGGFALSGVLDAGIPIDRLDQKTLHAIAARAVKAATLSTTKHGGIGSVPALADLTRMPQRDAR